MWKLEEPTDEYLRRHKKYEKKHSRELMAGLDNLDTLLNGLNKGLKIEQVRTFGFIHTEPHGILAIDQKGGGHGKLAQARLYILANPKTHLIHLITLGGKDTQEDDIKFCSEFAQALRNEEVKTYEHEKTL